MDRRKTDRRRENRDDVAIPDLLSILQILYRRKMILLPIVIAPVVLAFFAVKYIPDKYRAVATVVLENQTLNMTEFQDVTGGMKFDNLTVPTQIGVIKSPSLIRATAQSLDTDGTEDYEFLKHINDNLEVKQQGASRVIEISFKDSDPLEAAHTANAHAENYVLSQINAKKEQAKKAQEWIDHQIEQLKRETLRKSDSVQRFRVESGMVLGRNAQELVYQQISDIAAQLTQIEAKALDLQARNDLLNSGSTQSSTEIVQSRLVQDLKARSSAAQQKLEALRSDYGANHPEVVSARQEIQQIEKDIEREIGNIRKSIKNELATITRQKTLLEEKLTVLQGQADSFQEKQGTLQALQLEEAASQKLLDNFLARAEEIRSQIDFTRSDVRIVSLADIPVDPAPSKKPLILVGVLILSVMAGLAVVFLLEILDSGIHKKEDVKKLLNARFLGALPYEKHPIARILNKERSPYLEEIKRICVHLNTEPNNKILLFTSSRKGEGKSTVVLSLACYLASIGKKTLVLDADTISPAIARLSGVKVTHGLYDLLAGTTKAKDVIVKGQNGFHILPSLGANPLLSDLLLAGKIQPHLEAITKAYDVILIDSAPVPDVLDTEILSPLADQVILVTAWAKTPRKKMSNAVEILRQFSKNTPNIILTKADVTKL